MSTAEIVNGGVEPDEDELVDYEDGEPETANAADKGGDKANKGFVGVHSTGFKDFQLKPELLRSIQDCGFEHPSEVQHQCIPQALVGTDTLCQAKSGMGKTAVFVLSILHQIEPKDGQVSALVLCHTRELAFQICREIERFKVHMKDPVVRVGNFFGGLPVNQQREQLKDSSKCPHIVVGTPGRLKQLAKEKILKLNSIRTFVIDECDKVLEQIDMRSDVQEIFRMTPHDKQVMMFSATLPKDIRNTCKRFMVNPQEIYVDDEAKLTLHGLVQHYVMLNEEDKNRKLNDLLDALDFNQVVIFVKSVQRAVELNKLLNECNFPSVCLHKRLKQEERLKVYQQFKEGNKRILVATDLVGRGIDIERVNIVINYDMPQTNAEVGNGANTYLHRVGRAGRFGTKGLAITFVASEEDSKVLNQVQDRFDVDIKPLPQHIDPSAYMNTN
eukprot:TRINITY_DN3771_c0_g4_i1.p2 TRINITY_DN3771_c0_g4~~TRINITY_DN3771_c0_g4_i1.p2  ORF type:complete len:443 (-),score=56.25 TRINITY_DN3771_c0_g4_i1:198-1526(-)